MSEDYVWKQYATDVAWASKQAEIMAEMYEEVKNVNHYYFDIPSYN